MPPFSFRKRLPSGSPESTPAPKRCATRGEAQPQPRRTTESVFQTLDAVPAVRRTLSQTKALLDQEDDSSELNELASSDEFEDVLINNKGKAKTQEADSDAETDEDEWEDVLGQSNGISLDDEPVPVVTGDLELTLSAGATTPAFSAEPGGGKRASKIKREIRHLTHNMHVQFLMFHNRIRNSWIEDERVQKIIVDNLTTPCWREIHRFWRDSGITDGPERVVKHKWLKSELRKPGMWSNSDTDGVKTFGSSGKVKTLTGRSKTYEKKSKINDAGNSGRNGRDWGAASNRLEPDTPNLSASDPLLRLVKYLSAYWTATFRIAAPSLQKRGYVAPDVLEAEINAWKEDPVLPDAFGERLETLDDFRECARQAQGSRDVGQQLFTAMLRGLGIEARMVASLQPVGFGWTTVEEGRPKRLDLLKEQAQERENNTNTAPTSARKQPHPRPGTPDHSINPTSDESSAFSSALSSGSGMEQKIQKKRWKKPKYVEDLPLPTYWTEAISHLTHKPISVSPLPRSVIATEAMANTLLEFYPRSSSAARAKQVFAYIIAFSSDRTAKDVTTRYLPKHQWPGRTEGFRMSDDYLKPILRLYARAHDKRQPWDEVEDEGDLVPVEPAKAKGMDEGGKETLQGYKDSTDYVLERHIRREEALKLGAKVVRYFTTGRGENKKPEPVYRRQDIAACKTVESWRREGRQVNEGEQPLKFVPARAVTATRKREIEFREREEGEKVMQGLYSEAQTDWIILDPIRDGKIPKNVFGNIDVFVPTMVPGGAVHVPLKGTTRICRKLRIEFAEACTGFEFVKQRAVPVITGVVVAEENEHMVIDAWEADQAEKASKEAEKKEALVLGLWKKFFTGLKITERVKREYGEEMELPENPKNQKTGLLEDKEVEMKSEWGTFTNHEDFEGGFLRDEQPGAQFQGGFVRDEEIAGGFLPAGQDSESQAAGGFIIDHGDTEEPGTKSSAAGTAHQIPISLHQHAVIPQEDSGVDADEDGDEEASDGDAESESEPPDVPPRRTRKVDGSPSQPTRSTPKLNVNARKSGQGVKSHYFEHGSDEETDKLPQKEESGHGRGRGR
ncbi:Rad4-domain-containing protein [Amniculicola lignicola CBS 123094]|uniref:Rad4-domain-containing protein n=1 Tax=Amniculicola lignicola CBS 123094 TaxID=1392246 RepID=A0A6A5WD56_9PLEO|nr:Rad4-domain-containing protein [Amniculicola lignicola CBS 123094]